MKMTNDRSGLMSICRKAGKMKLGMDTAKSACDIGEAKGVFTASDLSAKSLKEMRYCGAKNGVPVYRLGMTMQQIGAAVGKVTGIIAVTDAGFAKSLAKGAENVSADIDEFFDQ